VAVVFVVDDDPVTCEAVARTLQRDGHDLTTFTHPEQALDAGRVNPPAVVITDFAMPGLNGLEFLLELRRYSPATTFIVVSGQATVEDAVSLMKHGVVDVQVKPPRARSLRKAVTLALKQHELAAENLRLRQDLRGLRGVSRVVGASRPFSATMRMVEKVAGNPSTVLITGETGTGKEVIAESIHELSPRADHRLVKVHCAAIPETLLESELFGHIRGSFTGAIRDKVGLFEEAHQGSIFLDEIGEITPNVQAKLLRVLQTGEVQRVGDTKTRKVDTRVMAATHRDLQKAVAEGEFREDLFYRLNVIPIHVPPLRERGDDVLLLARRFLAVEWERSDRGGEPMSFSAEAEKVLLGYSWPGNVREVQNIVTRLVALCDRSVIGVDDLPDSVRSGKGVPASKIDALKELSLEQAERLLILNAISRNQGNKKQAARQLGIGLATLYRKLQSYEADTGEA